MLGSAIVKLRVKRFKHWLVIRGVDTVMKHDSVQRKGGQALLEHVTAVMKNVHHSQNPA